MRMHCLKTYVLNYNVPYLTAMLCVPVRSGLLPFQLLCAMFMQFDVNGLSVTELLDDTDGLAKISDDNKVYIIPSRTFPLPDDSEQASIALTTFLDDEDDDDHNSPSPDNVRPESVTICVASRRDKNIDQAVTEIKKILKQDFVKETVCSLAVVCTCL